MKYSKYIKARLPESNIWNNHLPRIIALFLCEKRNNHPRLLFMEIRYVLYGKMKNILKTALCTFWHDMYKKWIKKQIEDSHEKKWHCNSSTCFHCQFSLHLFNFIFIHMLLKEKKRIIGKEWD